MELPNEAAFCSRCGNTTGNVPISLPAPPVFPQTSVGRSLLIGCTCVAGALLIFLMFCVVLAFAILSGTQQSGGRCCGVLPQFTDEWRIADGKQQTTDAKKLSTVC